MKSWHSSATPGQRQEFFREAKTMIALGNSHIVRLLGICTGVQCDESRVRIWVDSSPFIMSDDGNAQM